MIDLGVADRLRWIYETRRKAIISRALYEDDGAQLKGYNSRAGERKERWLVSINKTYDPVRTTLPLEITSPKNESLASCFGNRGGLVTMDLVLDGKKIEKTLTASLKDLPPDRTWCRVRLTSAASPLLPMPMPMPRGDGYMHIMFELRTVVRASAIVFGIYGVYTVNMPPYSRRLPPLVLIQLPVALVSFMR